jgi:hypothetical protein
MMGVLLAPIALGIVAALVMPELLAARSDSIDSPDAAIEASRQAWRSISEKTGAPAFKPASTSRFEPYSALLENGEWVVRGTIPPAYHGEVLVTRVRQSDGAVSVVGDVIK